MGSIRVSPTPGMLILPMRASRSDSNVIGAETTPSRLGATAAKISNATPPLLAAQERFDRGALRGCGLLVNHVKHLAVAFVHRSREPQHGGIDNTTEPMCRRSGPRRFASRRRPRSGRLSEAR
jgi:hypothetical protein